MATLSRKHFCLIAKALRDAKPIALADNDPRLIPWTNCVRELTDMCATTNARFNRDKFLTAANCDPSTL